MPNSDLTEIVVVLDRSGSMETIKSDMQGAFDAFVRAQREVPGEARVTLVQFDTQVETVHENVPVRDVPPLRLVPRGATALLDAVATAIDDVGARLAKTPDPARPGKVVFVVVTDGHENSSKRFTLADVRERVGRQTSAYKWQFVFLGANVDAFAEAGGMGMARGSAASYAMSGVAVRSAASHLSDNVARYRSTGDAAAMDWSAEQRDDMAKK